MHSATHAGQFLRLAETQGGIGIGSTDGKVRKKHVFLGALNELPVLGAILDRHWMASQIHFVWQFLLIV